MISVSALRARVARAGLHRPLGLLRSQGLDGNDVVNASHGRSGDTMLRFILAEILSGTPSSFDTIQHIVPEMGLQAQAIPLLPGNGRLMKTHEPYHRQYRRAIYLVRDVRDCVLSFFARETAVGAIDPRYRELDDYVLAFMQGKASHFGSWQKHVQSWITSPLAMRGDLLVIRFEDMRRDTGPVIARCLQFLGRDVEPGVVKAAVENNSLAKMREKEDRAERFPKSPLATGRQIGHGSIQGWRQKLSEENLKVIDEYAGETLVKFHYPLGVGAGPGGHVSSEVVPADFNAILGITEGMPPRGGREFRLSADAGCGERPLWVRAGGRIAKRFSWYRY